ncbi:MAG: hypothetical protein V3U10_01290 [Bacteroidota bacterium]
MPFSSTASCSESEWTEVFENVFCSAVEQCGYSCERAVPKTGSLITSIIERLRTARVVLADITDRNPNVFYELGVRHSLSKRTITVCQHASEIPSDLRGYWSLKYGLRPAQVTTFKNDIRRLIKEIEGDPEKSDSPVSDYLGIENISVFRYAQTENIKKLGALFTELTGNVLSLGGLNGDDSDHIAVHQISTDCLKLLLHTLYIDPGPDVLKQAYELLRDLEQTRSDAPDAVFIEQCRLSCFALGRIIMATRECLCRGEYEEPPNISTMVWQSPEGRELRGYCERTSCGGSTEVGMLSCLPVQPEQEKPTEEP